MPDFNIGDIVEPVEAIWVYDAALMYLTRGMKYRVAELDDTGGIHLKTLDGTDVPLHRFWNPRFFVCVEHGGPFRLDAI